MGLAVTTQGLLKFIEICSQINTIFKFDYIFLVFFIIICYLSAHPSCMNYSPELVHRITSDASAWQCIDCKACIICNDSGDPVSLSLNITDDIMARVCS